MTPPGIVAQIFAAAPPPAARRHHGIIVAVLLHLGVAILILRAQPTLETWSATMAARVHDELTRLQLAEVEPLVPTPPEPPPEPPPPAEQAPAPAEPAPAAPAPAPAPARPARPAPAQAGRVVAAPPGALDLTGDVVVVGSASAYAGGATSSTGTATRPTPSASPAPLPVPPPPAAPPADKKPAVDRARPVGLDGDEWNCPWPAEADGLELDEQVATIRVVVDARGLVESAELVADPGHGFGRAALACARRTRFTPALDRDGRPIRARSPAIRVHFFRDR